MYVLYIVGVFYRYKGDIDVMFCILFGCLIGIR